MTEYKQSGNNHDNYPDLLDILREKQKMRIGHPQSGEYVILEYSVKGANPKPESSTEIPTSSDLIDDAVSEANANPLPESLTSDSIEKDRTDEKSESSEENVRLGSKSMSEKTLKSDELISETQPAASRSLTDSKRQRLKQEEDSLNKARQITRDKLNQLRCSNASESDTARKFQLQQQIKSEKAQLSQLETELYEIEQKLSFYPALSACQTSSRQLDKEGDDSHQKREPPKVFISYSHDSEEHTENVRLLAKKLRKERVDCEIDQYVAHKLTNDWLRWMEREIEEAKFVLIVCTQKYKERADNYIGGVGWEARIIKGKEYTDHNPNKFITVTFREQDKRYKFSWLHGNLYVLDKDKYDKEFIRLCRQLTNQPDVIKPSLG
ncbi:MAG: TIR domain-containing protein [Tolypothrix brevis GSE-NOS-MK-07-07A]|nr:TIR domain-containing protein [Tolypothrix brevis GSE-NOS-MK-07-07A]